MDECLDDSGMCPLILLASSSCRAIRPTRLRGGVHEEEGKVNEALASSAGSKHKMLELALVVAIQNI